MNVMIVVLNRQKCLKDHRSLGLLFQSIQCHCSHLSLSASTGAIADSSDRRSCSDYVQDKTGPQQQYFQILSIYANMYTQIFLCQYTQIFYVNIHRLSF